MNDHDHIRSQTLAVFFFVYGIVFFAIFFGLKYTYGDNQLWIVVAMPVAFWCARRANDWYYRASVRAYNRQFENEETNR